MEEGSTVSEASKKTLAVLCGGGPAPGMNGVISALTIAARRADWGVLGVYDGFSRLARGEKEKAAVPLEIASVSRIHREGGSVLRTARFNPTKSEEDLRRVVDTLVALGVTHLATIGGDDTAYSASRVAAFAREKLGITLNVVHVPKTIDNDLPLPEGVPTFGFETARAVGTELVANLMEDARTTGRWYLVVAMGRTAGHLTLGMAKSSGATVALIPEEFRDKPVRLKMVVDILVGSIIKRLAAGKGHGVALVAEGLLDRLNLEDLSSCDSVERDEHGHVRYAEIQFGDILRSEVGKALRELGIKMTLVSKEIGYEVRCAPPVAFDVEYTRNLGYAAFEFLENGGSGAMITLRDNQVAPLPFEEMLDAATGKTQVRLVKVDSIQYRIARQYMIRIEKRDLEARHRLEQMAMAAHLTPDAFLERFSYITDAVY